MMHSRTNRPSHFVAAVCAALLALPASAAQVVAMDIEPLAGVKKGLAQTLTPMLIAEVAQLEGLSVISQADIRALLELEADKQSMGCDDSGCMADIAGSLGAELLMTSSIGRVGKEWVMNVTLIQVDGAKVIRRTTRKVKGPVSVASNLVVDSVRELFKAGLPSKVMGPASLSRRGFQAALAGLRRSVIDPTGDGLGSRRRVVLDMVNTELDFDANPKLEMFDLELRRGQSEIRERALAAKTDKEFQHCVKGIELYQTMWLDLGRVKEIRTRARERGIAPSATSLRFETPDPLEWPDAEQFAVYVKRTENARKVLALAVEAYAKNDEKGFMKLWAKDKESTAKRAFTTNRDSEARRKITYRVLPTKNFLPDLQTRAIESLERDTQVLYLLELRDGKPDGSKYVYFALENGKWRITSW